MKLIAKTLLCFAIFLPSMVLANVIYVNHASTGLNNGSSWQNAFNDLQDALSSTPIPDTIWIAKGTYYPTDGTDRYIYYQIPNGIAIYGGFEGTETQLSQRDWEINQTILSGDIGEQGDHSDNSFTILFATQTDTTTLIDGLIVTNGNANSTINVESSYGPTKSGGGLYLDGVGSDNFASIKVNNCKFLDNVALITGGAIFCYGFYGSVDFIISNSSFINNESESAGGAICKIGGCNLVQNLLFCNFENNQSGDYGGAYFAGDSNTNIDLNIEDCNFINNESQHGGAVARYEISEANFNDLKISNCLFEGNEVFGWGGAIFDDTYSSFGDIYLNNCNFIMNTSGWGGGVLWTETLETRTLDAMNCNFIENSNEAIVLDNFNFSSKNNLFYKNRRCITSTANIEIINNTFYKNFALYNSSIVKGGKVTVSNSIFWENEANFFSSFSSLEIGASIFDAESCDSISSQGSSNINCHQDVLFNIDPLFRDTANLDFSLFSCSPAINAGDTELINTLGILEDLAGNNRIIDGFVDIGAYEQAVFSVALDSAKNETCFGNSNGAVYISSSGNPPFDISWQSGSDSGSNTTGLSPGAYNIIISDADGCSDSLTVQIEAATGLMTNFESNDATGAGVADGFIDFEVLAGGTPGYTYEWNTGATTASISDLLPGNYVLTVTDAINCKYGFAFTVGVTSAIDNLEEEINFRIHPNPVSDFLLIEIENPISEAFEFQLFDELGRVVLKSDLPFLQNKHQINAQQISNGFYHYCIVHDRSVMKTGKLVVFRN